MKKVFWVLLILTIAFIFLFGCSGQNDCKRDPSVTQITSVQTPSVGVNDEQNVEVTVDTTYVPFNQVVENCTNIVKAKYLQTTNFGTHYEQIFEVQKQYKGTIQKQQIHVHYRKNVQIYVADKGYTYQARNDYIPGQSYVLLLTCFRSVYRDYDLFFIQGGLYIPVAGVSKARMYGQPLHEHIDLTKTQAESFSQVERYIIRQCATGSSKGIYSGYEYIQSSELSEILTQSPYVLRLEPISFVQHREYNCAERYKCKVVTTYKGNIEKEEIEVDFFADTVVIGDEYIVALSNTAIDYIYRFSAKGSLISLDQEQDVLAVLYNK